ncbi:MAG: DUF3102 domain-containing protein [Oscillospiraceae bacterium]|nr:DUF3102 domain-containing protein [Oscillospiraceae bacterium]
MDNNEIMTTAEITPQERAVLLDSRINANAKVAAESIVKVGRDLKEMRDEKLYLKLDCETFENYCDKKTPIKQRQAYNFIKCYEKYGERLSELSNIGITKLTLMSALDDEDSEQLIESGEAEELSTRELEKRIKELQSKNEQLTLELSEKTKEESAAEVLKQQIERLNTELEAKKAIEKQQKERMESLEKQNEELSKRPVDIAVEKPSKAEIEKIKKDAAEKAEKAAKKQHDKEIAELREQLAASEKANAEKLERLESENAALQSLAKKTPPSTQKERVKFHAEECLRNFNAALEAVKALPENEQNKPMATIKNMADKMKEMLSDE